MECIILTESIGILEKVSLSDKVYDILRTQIMSGELAPNTRLPENDIADKLQISRAPVREALTMLVNDGFIIRVPRHGAIVAPVTEKEIHENWDLRILLEPYGAKSACGHIPEKELLRVREIIENALKTCDFNEYMRSDYSTHSIIYTYVPNSQLQKLLIQTMNSSMRYRYYTENNLPTSSKVISAVCQEHLDLIDTLLKRDENEAYDAMLKHTKASYERIKKQLKI